MSTPGRWSRALRSWRDETGDTQAMGAARVVLGLLLLDAAMRAAGELRACYFGDAFHWPIVPEALVPSRPLYTALVIVEVLAAVLVVVGLRARAALFASAATSTYVLLCDRLQFHHNRWAMACYALLFALAPCDRCYTLAAWRRPPDATTRIGPLWAARLAQLQVSIIYLASGGSKLLDPDWRAGRVLATRMALYGQNALDAGVPRGIVDLLSDPSVAGALAKLAIATELLLSVGLWPRRTRSLALWWGVWFHLTIEATSRVEGFTWLTLAMYALFARPDVGARTLVYDPSRPAERLGARVLARLDWLARFRFEPSLRDGSGTLGTRGGLVVLDRASPRSRHERPRRSGIRAFAAITRATPVFFPLWLPIAALASVVCYFGPMRALRGHPRAGGARGGGG